MRNCSVPAGTLILIVSPLFLPLSAWAIGDFIDILPALISASCGLTIVYDILP